MTAHRALLLATGVSVLCASVVGVTPVEGTASPPQRGDATPAADARINALVVSGGCCHDYPTQDQLLIDIVRRSLPVDWTIVYQGGTARESKIPLYAKPDWIEGFDIVVHNECFGFVDDPAYIRTITEAHRRTGTPAVVTHCSMHSYRNAAIDDWREFVGVTSRRHTAAHRIAVRWSATGDPLMQGLAPAWTTPTDELYVIEKVWPNTKPLATAVSPEEGTPVFPVIWTNSFHGARVFGTTLGHQDTWTDPVFQDVLTRGFTWALNRTR